MTIVYYTLCKVHFSLALNTAQFYLHTDNRKGPYKFMGEVNLRSAGQNQNHERNILTALKFPQILCNSVPVKIYQNTYNVARFITLHYTTQCLQHIKCLNNLSLMVWLWPADHRLTSPIFL